MTGDYVELTGDDIPYHLRRDAEPTGECNVCHRQTWTEKAGGMSCQMPQPDGSVCVGFFVHPSVLLP